MNTVAENLTGTVLEIQRMSTEDGPGIRTTVFLKGCTLACAWCHNPESIHRAPQLQWTGSRCIACRTCITLCPENALTFDHRGVTIDRDKCKTCGGCESACPGTALEILGTKWNVNDLAYELAKDRAWFGNDGGVTIGGGEASMQANFTAALMEKISISGINVALDTCGQASRENLIKVLPYADLILYDLKLIDSEEHRKWTGSPNDVILDNLRFLAIYMKDHLRPRRLWIRTPLVPGATATKKNIAGIGSFIANNLEGMVERWELLAFNNLCRDKYLRLGINWKFADTPLLTGSELEAMKQAAYSSGIDPKIVCLTGSAAIEGPKLSDEEKKRQALLKRTQACSTTQEKLS